MNHISLADWLEVITIGVPMSNATSTVAERCCERSQRCPND